MQKTHAPSPRVRLWLAGFLILAGALVLVSTGLQQIYWWPLHPPPSGWYEVSDSTYSGILSEANQSVMALLESAELAGWGRVRLLDISTNSTPITITLRDWNNTVVLQLVNCTGDSGFGPTECVLYGTLVPHGLPGILTLTITRQTSDVTFSVRVIIEGHIFVDLVLVPLYSFLLGYVCSLAMICAGFVIIEDVARDVRQGRF